MGAKPANSAFTQIYIYSVVVNLPQVADSQFEIRLKIMLNFTS